jgi:hypothetical protein
MSPSFMNSVRAIAFFGLAISLLFATVELLFAIADECRISAAAAHSSRQSVGHAPATDKSTASSNDTESQVNRQLPEIMDLSVLMDDSRDQDAGIVIQGDSCQKTFVIRNPTDKPLTVKSVRKSCGCQKLNLVEGAVVPAGKILAFTYGFETVVAGHKRAKLTVQTDSKDPALQEIGYSLTVDVRPVLTAAPSSVHFGAVNSGHASQQKLRVTSINPELLTHFRSVTTSRSIANVNLVEQTPDELVFEIEVPAITPAGRFSDHLMLGFRGNGQQMQSIIVPIDGVIAGN